MIAGATHATVTEGAGENSTMVPPGASTASWWTAVGTAATTRMAATRTRAVRRRLRMPLTEGTLVKPRGQVNQPRQRLRAGRWDALSLILAIPLRANPEPMVLSQRRQRWRRRDSQRPYRCCSSARTAWRGRLDRNQVPTCLMDYYSALQEWVTGVLPSGCSHVIVPLAVIDT